MNDFYIDGLVVNPEALCYVKREAEDKLIEALRLKKICCILSYRTAGKSSLMKYVNKQLITQSSAICISINLYSIVSNEMSEKEFYKAIIHSIIQELKSQLQFDSNSWVLNNIQFTAVQYFDSFLKNLLRQYSGYDIYIFLDEIDVIVDYDFSDNFFAFIDTFYEDRNKYSEHERLTFAFFGVTTISELIKNKNQKVFTSVEEIELRGFTLEEANTLAKGLEYYSEQPNIVIEKIFKWTNGQPFLTQYICKSLCQKLSEKGQKILSRNEENEVDSFVRERIIENREPEKTESNYFILYIKEEGEIEKSLQKSNEEEILRLYLDILQDDGKYIAQDNLLEKQLLLSGLVIRQDNYLKPYNLIYKHLFNKNWVNHKLSQLFPLKDKMKIWEDCQTEDKDKWLLTSDELIHVQKWENGKKIDRDILQYLRESESQESRIRLNKREEENRRKSERITRWVIAGFIVVFLGGMSILSEYQRQQQLKEFAENMGNTAISQFQLEELEAMKTAMKSAKALKDIDLLSNQTTLANYPTVTPLLALRTILDRIQEQTQWIGKHGRITKVSFNSFKKNTLAIGTEDGKVLLWDFTKDKEPKDLGINHKKEVTDLQVSSNGSYFVSVGQDRQGIIWDMDKSKLLHKLPISSAGMYSVSINPDDDLIATGEDYKIRFWNKDGQNLQISNKNGQLSQELDAHKGKVEAIAFSPVQNQKLIATAGGDGIIKLWKYSVDDNKIHIESKGKHWHHQQNIINSLRFSPKGEFIATAGKNGKVILWDLNGNPIVPLLGHQNSVLSLSFKDDGKLLATASQDGTVILWNISNIKHPQRLTQLNGHKGSVTDVSFQPNGNLLATAGQDGTVRIWNLSKLLESLTLESFSNVTFSPDGKTVAAIGKNGKVSLWKLPSDKSFLNTANSSTILDRAGKRCQEKVTSLAFKDDQTIILGTEKGNIYTFNTQGDFQDDKSWKQAHSGAITSIAVNLNNPNFIWTTSKDGKIKKWSLIVQPNQPKKQALEEKDSSGIEKIATFFNPTNLLITQTDSETLSTRDLDLGNQNPFGKVLAFRFSSEGKYLVIAKENNIELWDSSDLKKPLKTWNNQGKVISISWSSDNKYLATVGQYGIIRIWKIDKVIQNQKPQPYKEWPGHIDLVTKVAFSPDGEILATAGKDNKVKLWNWQGNQIDNKKLQIAEFDGNDFYFPEKPIYSSQKQIIIQEPKGGLIPKPIQTLDELLQKSCEWLKYDRNLNSDKDISQTCPN